MEQCNKLVMSVKILRPIRVGLKLGSSVIEISVRFHCQYRALFLANWVWNSEGVGSSPWQQETVCARSTTTGYTSVQIQSLFWSCIAERVRNVIKVGMFALRGIAFCLDEVALHTVPKKDGIGDLSEFVYFFHLRGAEKPFALISSGGDSRRRTILSAGSPQQAHNRIGQNAGQSCQLRLCRMAFLVVISDISFVAVILFSWS